MDIRSLVWLWVQLFSEGGFVVALKRMNDVSTRHYELLLSTPVQVAVQLTPDEQRTSILRIYGR